MTWWEYLQRELRRMRMSQADLARALGVPSSTVSRWQNQAPSPDNLRRLADVLDVPVIELFVRAGYLTRAEADVREVPTTSSAAVDVIEAIEADEHLLPEAKAHFLNQYRLLLRLGDVSEVADRQGAERDGPGLRAVARRRRGTGGTRKA